MKFFIKSLGEFDYLEHDKVLYESLGFVFEKSDKLRFGPGYWYRKVREPIETIEISSLEELIAFTNKYGDCIVENGILTINNCDKR